MKAKLTLIPTLIVHPSSCIIFNQVLWDPCRPPRSTFDISDNSKPTLSESFIKSERKAHGKVSIQASRKMSKAIDYLITTSYEKKVFERVSGKTVTFKIAFVTLTLPSKQLHSDSEIINKCLNSFLLEIKKYYNCEKYVWRAEKQENGNIHFHLLIDKFIPYYELRNRWNRIINKLQYVDEYQKNMKEFYKSGFKISNNKNDKRTAALQYISYQKASSTNFNSPNSTDIHSTKKIRNIKKYITKYMTKNEKQTAENQQPGDKELESLQNSNQKNVQQTGRIWACSHNLSSITGFRTEIDSEISNELKNLQDSGKCRIFKDTYFSVIYVDFKNLRKLGSEILFRYFANYLLETFDYKMQLSL